MIHIARDRQQLGKFTEDEVAEGLRSGRFLPTDLAWRDPMVAWKPLGEFDDLPEPEPDLEDLPPPVPDVVGETFTGTEPAWERRAEIGIFPAIAQTVSEVLLNPGRTFAAMKQQGGLRTPFIYFLILGIPSIEIVMMYQFVIALIDPAKAFPQYQGELTTEFVVAFFAGMAVISPVVLGVSVFVWAWILHLSLTVLDIAGKPFEATFRVFCYAFGSAILLQVIPMCGQVIYPVWGAICLAVGLKLVHQADWPRTIAAVVLPFLFCCGAMFAIGLIAGLSGAVR